MIAPGKDVALADVRAIVTEANTKLAPADPYGAGGQFDDSANLAAPKNIVGVIAYSPPGSPQYEAPDLEVAVFVYPHGTDEDGVTGWGDAAGYGSVTSDASSRAFKVGWSWDAVDGADGYLVVLVKGFGGGGQEIIASYYQQVALPALDDDGNGWKVTWPFQYDLAGFSNTGDLPSPVAALQELNRIRKDVIAQIFDEPTSPVYLSRDALVSDPQVVGVNPPPERAASGKLYLFRGTKYKSTSPGPELPAAGWLPVFKGIKFAFALADEALLWGSDDITNDNPWITGETDAIEAFYGSKILEFNLTGVYTGSLPDVTFTTTFNCHCPVDATAWIVFRIPLAAGGYERQVVQQDLAAGDTAVPFSVTGAYNGGEVTIVAEFFFKATFARAVNAASVHPSSDVIELTIDDVADPDDLLFTLNGHGGYPYVAANVPAMKGCWIARTLPTPGLNVYLDVDFPTYVEQIVDDTFNGHRPQFQRQIAIARTTDDYAALAADFPASAMRQPSPTGPRPDVAFDVFTPTLAPAADFAGQFYFPGPAALSFQDEADPIVLTTETFAIYVSRRAGIDPADATTWGFKTTTGVVNFADVRAWYDGSTADKTADGRTLYFLVRNTGGGSTIMAVIVEKYQKSRINRTTPGIGCQPSQVPTMRDTDPMQWHQYLDPYRSKGTQAPSHVPANGTLNDSVFIQNGTRNWKLTFAPASATLTVYVDGQNRGFPTPGDASTYDVATTTGVVQKSDFDALGIDVSGVLLNIVFKNTAAAAVDVTLTSQNEFFDLHGNYQATPVFFPANGFERDREKYVNGVYECFSTNIHLNDPSFSPFPTLAGTGFPNLIPQRGYAVVSVLARRLPVKVSAGDALHRPLHLPKTDPADLQELAVAVGTFKGTMHTLFEAIDKGVFTAMTTITIPEGELEASVDVFWPILAGAPIVYQATEDVLLEAVAAFQPVFYCPQYSGLLTGDIDSFGRLLTNPAVLQTALCYQNFYDADVYGVPHPVYWPTFFGSQSTTFAQFPMAACVLKDLKALLDLL